MKIYVRILSDFLEESTIWEKRLLLLISAYCRFRKAVSEDGLRFLKGNEKRQTTGAITFEGEVTVKSMSHFAWRLRVASDLEKCYSVPGKEGQFDF